MNFCGTRVKTEEPAVKNPAKKMELLEEQPGMWKCEKEAIKEHNDNVALQNKGALLSTLKTVDMSFLGKLDKNKHPVFGVFPTTSFKCKLTITLGSGGTFSTIGCGGLPKIIGDGYRTGLKGKKLANRYKNYNLSANFVGLLPQKTKEKIVVLKEAGIATYLIADTQWKSTPVKAPNPDPLVIALYNSTVYLVDVFDASIEENYVAHEFTEDAESA
jgi:hypothetical protein